MLRHYEIFQVSGIVLLACGIWMQVELYKYFVLSGEFPVTGPYVLIGTGALIVMVGSFACCCTIKGQPALLYMVIKRKTQNGREIIII